MGIAEKQPSYREALSALEALVAASPAGASGAIDPVDGAHALWGAMHGISALATGFTMYSAEQARSATDATLDLLVAGLWPERRL